MEEEKIMLNPSLQNRKVTENRRELKVREKSLDMISWAMMAYMGRGPSFVWEEKLYSNELNEEIC